MDYEVMLDFHEANKADVTLATLAVPMEEASRFGIVITDDNKQIQEFEEKPEHPRSNLASMGIYIFSWPVLRDALIKLKDQPSCDFGKHIIPYCHDKGSRIFAYEFNGYWKDVGTLGAYWEANMELIDIVPVFNLYEEFWKIFTKTEKIPPQYVASDAIIDKAIIGEASEIYGEVHNSVIGAGVVIKKGAVVRDSIIMNSVEIGEGTVVDKAIISENTTVGANCVLGTGEEAPNKVKPSVYAFGLVTIGEDSVIPDGVKIGKNTAISGETVPADYPDNELEAGETLIKVGDR
jgi:glucose-1-phosphate adenylyltransferase